MTTDWIGLNGQDQMTRECTVRFIPFRPLFSDIATVARVCEENERRDGGRCKSPPLAKIRKRFYTCCQKRGSER